MSAPPTPTPTLSPAERDAHYQTIARALAPALRTVAQASAEAIAPVDFGARHFYVPETSAPIIFYPPQQIILECMFDPAFAAACGCPDGWQTFAFSTVKKSGKTTIAALLARWIAETWGNFNEVYCVANDKEQARGRVYAKALQSIELDPRYDKTKQLIPGYWRIIERQATHIPSGSYLRAVSSDYKGEAGANPTATFWSELWGYTLEASRRLWDEMTPVPTRPRSIRFVETYAGFEGESTLLIDLYELVTKEARGAHRLTAPELADLTDGRLIWPTDEHELPLYINPEARAFAYWDTDEVARRMPWQTPGYYKSQAALRPEAFERFHLNHWVSPTSAFIPREWWIYCRARPEDQLPPLDPREPLVLSADASVSGDCTALTAVSRNPLYANDPARKKETVARLSRKWTPPAGGKLNYNLPEGLKPTIREWCSKYNIVQIAYDPYQLHDVMTELRDEGIAWTRPFSQGDERMIADFGLYTDIRDRKIMDDTGDPDLAEHLENSAARIAKDSVTKLRIVKRSEDKKIDLAVCLSMANAECKRLNL